MRKLFPLLLATSLCLTTLLFVACNPTQKPSVTPSTVPSVEQSETPSTTPSAAPSEEVAPSAPSEEVIPSVEVTPSETPVTPSKAPETGDSSQVSAEEWAAAMTASGATNYRVESYSGMEAMGYSLRIVSEVDGTNVKVVSTETMFGMESVTEFYLTIIDGAYTQISVLTDGSMQKTALTEEEWNALWAEYVDITTIDLPYANFTYDESEKAYKADSFTVPETGEWKNVVVQFENKQFVSFSATNVMEGMIITATCAISYGGVTVTIPAV